MRTRSSLLALLALLILDGWDPSSEPRYVDVLAGAEVTPVNGGAAADDERRELRQRE